MPELKASATLVPRISCSSFSPMSLPKPWKHASWNNLRFDSRSRASHPALLLSNMIESSTFTMKYSSLASLPASPAAPSCSPNIHSGLNWKAWHESKRKTAPTAASSLTARPASLWSTRAVSAARMPPRLCPPRKRGPPRFSLSMSAACRAASAGHATESSRSRTRKGCISPRARWS